MGGILKKKELEMVLQHLAPIPEPDPSLEQYQTPADIGADLLFHAYSNGDITGRSVIEPGCGNGLLLLGAGLLGASRLVGFDADPKAVRTAEKNMKELKEAGYNISALFLHATLPEWDCSEIFDTALMNPPFGAQKKGADRPFLSFALSHAAVVYSLHLFTTRDFVMRYIEKLGARGEVLGVYNFSIKHTFAFHTMERRTVKVMLLRAESR